MHINTKRIYMNEVDASPGNGAPAAPSPAPAAPTAAPTAPEIPPLTIDLVKNQVADQLKAFQNEFFASARKAGLLGKDKPNGEPTPPTQPTQSAPAAAQAGLTLADVEVLLERKGVVSSRAAKYGLNPAQTKRFEAAMSTVAPESLDAEADAYLTDMGLARTPETPTTTAAPVVVQGGPPISDKGSPAPGGVVNWQREYAENPVNMSPAARSAMDAEIDSKSGQGAARKMRIEAANKQLARIKVVTK